MIKCPVCGMEFDTEEEHDKHHEETHGRVTEMENFKCPICGFIAEDAKQFTQHNKEHMEG